MTAPVIRRHASAEVHHLGAKPATSKAPPVDWSTRATALFLLFAGLVCWAAGIALVCAIAFAVTGGLGLLARLA